MSRLYAFRVALAIIAVSALAGCGSTASDSSIASSADTTLATPLSTTPAKPASTSSVQTEPTPVSQTASTAAAPNTSSTPSFVVNATTQDGDKVKIEGRFGPPLPASQSGVNQTSLSECSATAGDGRAVVVELSLSVTDESSLEGEVELIPGGLPTGVQADYLMDFSSGAQCAGTIQFGTLRPHQSTSLIMWIVFPNVVTPNDTHPTEARLPAAEWLMALPQVTVDGTSSRVGHVSATGSHVVKCVTGGPLSQSEDSIAILRVTPKTVRTGFCPES
jgi:hypothetical protein